MLGDRMTQEKQLNVKAELSDGRSGSFDVKPYLEKGVFTQLQYLAYFKTG